MARSLRRALPRTLTGRLVLWFAGAILAVFLVLGVVADRALEGYLVDQITESLQAQARAVRLALPSGSDLQERVVPLGRELRARITVIRADGVVLADSERDPATMENHADRPEVRQALAGRVGVATRRSATTGTSFRYVALPPSGGRIVRVALPLTEVADRVGAMRLILAVGFGAATLAGVLVALLISRRLTRPLRDLSRAVERVRGGDLDAAVPEEGTEELVLLARALNRAREELASRMALLERERAARDAILSSLEEGVVLFDARGTVIYQNRRARQALGGVASLRQLDPRPLRDLVQAVAAGAGPGTAEAVVGPSSRVLHATAAPVPGDGHLLLVLRDVTEARRVDAVRRDFVANASHELKTPAASIRALAETIEAAARKDPGSVPRFAAQLEREAIRLARVVSDLLDLSRLEGPPGERTEVRLDRLVAEEAERHRRRAEAAGLSLAVNPDGPVAVWGSAQDLALLVRNLVENAIQYTRAGGSVEVRVAVEEGSARLDVRDSGIGIPARDQARIFERFYRVDRARSRETGGTGLGLSIVKHVAESHGGTVTVDSRLGEGSTFTVRLPLA